MPPSKLRTIADIIPRLPSPDIAELEAPLYRGSQSSGIVLSVESMRRHMTDEGWQLQIGLEGAGYPLWGHNLPNNETDVPRIMHAAKPGVVVVQDKREWDAAKPACWDKKAEFKTIHTLATMHDVFRLTILKDAHQQYDYHAHSAIEMGAHGWIVYYAPQIVHRLAPYVRPKHLIRTYHSLDKSLVPRFNAKRLGCLLSGAASNVYPLRRLLISQIRHLPQVDHLKHPGYHADGCHTESYMRMLSKYKVAICTSSIYGYTLRKIIEATACGCIVVTDLPTDDVMPEIDENLVRVPSTIPVREMSNLLIKLYAGYNVSRQKELSDRAKSFYDYREVGRRLVSDIEKLRTQYNGVVPIAEKEVIVVPATVTTAEEAIAKMVSPGMRRPKVTHGGVLQIWVTRACDKACFGCTQGSNLGGKPGMITAEQFEQACLSLQDYFGVVGVFGGNPAVHPQFEALCDIMARHIPKDRRGLWCNNLMGKGAAARRTFNPAVSNLNVHLDQAAYDEFRRDWPEARAFGLTEDSRHSPPYVAMQDVVPDEAERWNLIANCDINRNWSAMIGVFRGQLRGYFCEIAGAQAMLHQHNPDYPDLGVPIEPGWWKKGMPEFAEQVKFHCQACGVPLRGFGELAQGNGTEQVSETHREVYKLKTKDRPLQIVTSREELGAASVGKFTDYLQNSKL